MNRMTITLLVLVLGGLAGLWAWSERSRPGAGETTNDLLGTTASHLESLTLVVEGIA